MRIWNRSVLKIDSLDSVQRAIDEVLETDRWSSDTLWRGHGDAKWPLIPHVFRPNVLKSTDLESEVLWDFMMRAPSRIANPPGVSDWVGWMHIAQHYGLPTRLLDWTFSPLIALYFACCNEERDTTNGCLWALEGRLLNKGQDDHEHLYVAHPKGVIGDLVSMALDEYSGDEDLPNVLAFMPRHIDLRMLVQSAAFTIHGTTDDMRKLDVEASCLKRFLVPAAAKRKIRKTLAASGVSRSTLFPDLAALAVDVVRIYS